MYRLDREQQLASRATAGKVAVPEPKFLRCYRNADYGRRGKGYIFGALQEATGATLTASHGRRTAVNWVDFLERVEAWIAPEVERVYAIVDNLSAHRATDVLLFSLAHPAGSSSSNPSTPPT